MEESSKKRGRPLRWFLIGAVTLGVLALAAWFVVFRVNRFSLELVLTGEPKLLLEYGDFALGFVKNLGNRTNSLLLQGRRIRMDI